MAIKVGRVQMAEGDQLNTETLAGVHTVYLTDGKAEPLEVGKPVALSEGSHFIITAVTDATIGTLKEV